jgi:2-keto-4-pentenoate hydratase/2-oxohepta-3-ene-1,7-dioic acid hydratase in catechol pathway
VKLLRLGPVGAEQPAVRADDGRVYGLSGITDDIHGAFLASDGPARAAAALAAGELPELDPTGLRVGAPVARPGKLIVVGLNYRDHAAEAGLPLPERPVVLLKDPATVVGPYDEVLIPRGSASTDWEVELGVVIGSRARYLQSPAEAAEVIAGYTVSNDVSEREFQFSSPQWGLGKCCETFNPLGPWLVTPDEVDARALGLRLAVNGVPRQDGNTKDMVFDVPFLVHFLSRHLVLEPGDVITTGTPAGVALGLPDTPYLRPGDVMEVSIDGLGGQRLVCGQA